MKVEQARAELEVLEIERTNLTVKQMVGFVDGWKLAGATETGQMAQGTVDRLNELLEDSDRQEFQIGRFIGYVRYFQELLCQTEEAESEVEVAELLVMATGSEEVH